MNNVTVSVFFSAVGGLGNGSNQFYNPYDMALDPVSGILYITDNSNHRIMSYAKGANSGTLVFGGMGPGMNNTQLNGPLGIYFDSFLNSLIIANVFAHNIIRYSLGTSGWTLRAGNINGSAGSTSTSLSSPNDIILDPMGNMYVADTGNRRIQFFYRDQWNGITIAGIAGVVGVNANTLNTPRSVALDGQLNLYIADDKNHCIQKFLRY